VSVLFTIGAFVVALGVMIVVHEYGHYLVARLCNVKVLRFSVGFGKPLAIWRRGADRTEWAIAAIPFGGYVKMLDEREGEVAAHEAHRAFNRQSLAKRAAIVVAGPAFNLLFATAVYAALFMVGLPELRPVLDAPAQGSAAAAAGVLRGDVIRRIDGREVLTWQDARWRVLQGALQGEPVMLEVERAAGGAAALRLDLSGFAGSEPDEGMIERIGLKLSPLPVLGELEAHGVAERAGLRRGDRITQLDGKPVESWDAFVKAIRQRAGVPTRLSIERSGAALTVDLVPESVAGERGAIGRIGAAPSYVIRVRYGFVEGLGKGALKTWDMAAFSLRMLGKMLLGEVSWRNLSGPVTIADYAGQSAQLGWIPFLTFLALISISLGVLNLLPIPLLDGGHLMYYVIEAVKGSPVPERVIEIGQRVGLTLLLLLMAFALYNDLHRLFLAG
jgi:regulator of sigma E protease